MIKGLRDLERDVERFKKRTGDSMASSAARRLERNVLPEMKSKIVRKDAVASTELFRSFSIRILGGGMAGDRFIHLTNNAPHAVYVEFGTGGFHKVNPYTRAFAAPPMSPHLVAEIRKWMFTKPSFTDPNPSLAHAIATAIAFGGTDRFGRPRPPGTPRSPFFFNTWFEESQTFRDAMSRSFGRHVERTFGVDS